MTFLHLVNAAILIAIIIGAIALYRHLKRDVDDADGVIDINTRGEDGLSSRGTIVGAVGNESSTQEDGSPMAESDAKNECGSTKRR